MEKYICVHGHFYQPPRENPWLEEVELQDEAYPYHDWNERITFECYEQNATSRILGSEKRIVDIVNNYSQMSFNFGPTLLSWMERHTPNVYQALLEADKKSMELFNGHGAAIAQAYNHMIMPLANEQDKHTQILWGIADFKYRFNRDPEGMWLPETACDTPTLEQLADKGIKFTILAPRQAKRIRKIGSEDWQNVTTENLETRRGYLCNLPSGKQITLFFYDGVISNHIAYGPLLNNGENFAKELSHAFHDNGEPAQLVHIATDGESYGHHHRHGDMALAYCLHHIREHDLANLTIYGEFLEKFPPQYEAEIHECSSWSCDHGVERWRAECACHTDRYPNGTRAWKAPLRIALDTLRDTLIDFYEEQMSAFAKSPWDVRDAYIDVLLNRSFDSMNTFVKKNAKRELEESEKVRFFKLLELQRNAQLMYTSCGWFFDDISGLETVQIMQYAARAMQLARELGSDDLFPAFRKTLEDGPCNDKHFANSREVFEQLVEPTAVDLCRVGAHFAVSSLFNEYEQESDVFCYTAIKDDYDRLESGVERMAIGRITVTSKTTMQSMPMDFAVLHYGEQNLVCGVSARLDDKTFEQMREELADAFTNARTAQAMQILISTFGENTYSLWHLFKDEQRRIVRTLLHTTFEDIESSFRNIFEHNYTIMMVMRSMRIPLPSALLAPAQFILQRDFQELLKPPVLNFRRMRDILRQCDKLELSINEGSLVYDIEQKLTQLLRIAKSQPEDMRALASAVELLDITKPAFANLHLQNAQNLCFEIGRDILPKQNKKKQTGNEMADRWIEVYTKLAYLLHVQM